MRGTISKNVKEVLLRTLNTSPWQGKACEEPFSRAAYVPFCSIKVKDIQEEQFTHTYALREAKIFMEAAKWNKEETDIIKW